MTSKCIVLLSGGMDSATLVYDLLGEGAEVDCLSVRYGQRHARELTYAAELASRLHLRWDVIDLSSVGLLLSSSALTNPTREVPHGHYTDETMRITVVPNRNALLLAAATAVAVARGATRVATAVHAGDHAIYPDCRPAFINALETAFVLGNEGFASALRIHAPFINRSKAEICGWGHFLGVDYSLTYSCYEGGEVHCGKCGTCVERREAFELAGVDDPTVYADV